MGCLFPLLLLVPLQTAFAGGAGERWWCDDLKCYHEDYAYVEAIIIVMLVMLAVLFDTAHHYLEHIADHSYWYGKLQSVAPETHASSKSRTPGLRAIKQRTPLFKHWVNRLSMEFMVLGFLAFFVFVSREAGFFDWLVHAFPPDKQDVHLPKTPEDWLHMVENVHMKLFLGMIVYFVLILKVVKGCSKHVEFWEEMRIMRRSSRSGSDEDISHTSCSGALGHTRLRRYSRWRLYFIKSVMNWRETRPKLYEETLKRLSMWSSDTPSQTRIQRALDGSFPFSAYLAYSVRACCKDTVDIHRITWAAVMVLFTAFALIHRYAKLILLHFMPVFILGAFLLLFCVGRLVRVFRQHVESAGAQAVHIAAAAENAECDGAATFEVAGSRNCGRGLPDLELGGQTMDSQDPTEGFHERYSTELWVFRMLQIFLFVLSYSCARTVGDPNDWRNRPQEVLAVSSGFLVLFLVLGSLLPKYVPNFAALMAMPPYCDHKNVETFFEVLDEYNTQHGLQGAEDSMRLTGSVHPCFLSDSASTSLSGASSEWKKSCAHFGTAISTLTQQQKQLASQVQEVQSSLRKAPESAVQPVFTEPLKHELAMMRTQLAHIDSLMQRSLCQSPMKHVEETVVVGTPVAHVGSSPHHDQAKAPLDSHRWCSNSRELQFFSDPLTTQTLTRMECQSTYEEPTRGTDVTTSEQCLSRVVN